MDKGHAARCPAYILTYRYVSCWSDRRREANGAHTYLAPGLWRSSGVINATSLRRPYLGCADSPRHIWCNLIRRGVAITNNVLLIMHCVVRWLLYAVYPVWVGHK